MSQLTCLGRKCFNVFLSFYNISFFKLIEEQLYNKQLTLIKMQRYLHKVSF